MRTLSACAFAGAAYAVNIKLNQEYTADMNDLDYLRARDEHWDNTASTRRTTEIPVVDVPDFPAMPADPAAVTDWTEVYAPIFSSQAAAALNQAWADEKEERPALL